jgi:uncharacterized integral membrane protein
MMKLLTRLAAVILFVLFFGFALENTHEAVLHFFLNYEIRGPMVLVLLGFFLMGAVMGILAMMPMVFRHRRESSKHQKTVNRMEQEQQALVAARANPRQAEAVVVKP